MNIKKTYLEFSRLGEYLKSLSLLFARLLMAYGFYEPAMMKWNDMKSVAEWFGSIPMIIIMIVAIVTVHLHNGFSAGDNGFEIPLYYKAFF